MTLYETKELCIMSDLGTETDGRNKKKFFFIQWAITETRNRSRLLYED